MTIISVTKFLKEELARRQTKNASYSLRAFARGLGISAGGLAQILNGKRKLSVERAYTLAEKLNLTDEEKKLFILTVRLEQVKSSEAKADILDEIATDAAGEHHHYFDLSVDQFKLISQWYGLAILECICSYGQNFDATKIASHFDISFAEAAIALERLQRLELVELDSEDRWCRVADRVLIQSKTQEKSITRFYKSVAKQSLSSYEEASALERISGCETFTVEESDLEKARALTNNYLDAMAKLNSKKVTAVRTYQALVNVFPVSKINKENL